MKEYARSLSYLLSPRKNSSSEYEERTRQRYRRILITMITEVGAKGINIFATLISVPLTIHYLGTERYGMWLTISSLIIVLQFTDLGLGNGVLNAVSEANGKDDRKFAQVYISSGFYLLVSIALLLAGILLVSYPYISWSAIFNVVSDQAVKEAGPATAIYLISFLIGLPFGLVQRIQLGYQEGFLNSIWTGIGSLGSLVCLLIVIQVKAGLPWLALAMTGVPLAATIANGLWLFTLRRPWLWPQPSLINREAVKKIFNLGTMFFLLQVAVAFAFSSDNLIAARVLGPDAVTEYAVPMRLFSTIMILIGLVQQPFWPAYGEAFARRDQIWIKRTLIRSIQVSVLLSSAPSLILIIFGQQIIHWWVGPQVSPSFLLLIGLALWTVLSAIGTAQAMFLNGAGIIKFQAFCSVAMAVSALITKFFFAQMFGIVGIVGGMVISYTIFTAIPMAIYIPRVLARINVTAVDATA